MKSALRVYLLLTFSFPPLSLDHPLHPSIRLREILTSNKRLQQRVLVVAMKPPRDLVKVLLEREWGWGSGGGGGHVDLLVSKSFSSALGEAGMGDAMRQLGDLDMDRALRMLHRVFVVQVVNSEGGEGGMEGRARVLHAIVVGPLAPPRKDGVRAGVGFEVSCTITATWL